MKKLALVLLIVLIPAAFVSAEISFGPMVGYADSISTATSAFDSANLLYGLEARAKFFIFRADYSFFYEKGEVGSYFFVPVDAGLSLDLFFLRAGLAFGANFFLDPQTDSPFSLNEKAPFNLKASADILVGKHLSIGAEAMLFLDSESLLYLLEDPSVLGSVSVDDLYFSVTTQVRF